MLEAALDYHFGVLPRFCVNVPAVLAVVVTTTYWRFVVSLLATSVVVVLVFLLVDFGELVLVMSTADYRYVVPAVVFYFLSLWLRGMRWRLVLSATGRSTSMVALYPCMVLGYAANNVLPARVGEVVRAWAFIQRNPGTFGGTVFSTIVVERVFDGFFLSAFGALAFGLMLMTGYVVPGGLWIAGGLIGLLCTFAVLAVVIFILLLKMSGGRRYCRRLGWALVCVPLRFRRPAYRWLLLAGLGLGGMRSIVCCRRVFCWTSVSWLVEAVVFLCVAKGFGLDSFPQGIFALLVAMFLAMAASNFGGSVPLGFGGLGSFEAAASQVLVLVGVVPEVALAYALAVHLLVSWLPVNVAGVGVVLLWTIRRRRARLDVGR